MVSEGGKLILLWYVGMGPLEKPLGLHHVVRNHLLIPGNIQRGTERQIHIRTCICLFSIS